MGGTDYRKEFSKWWKDTFKAIKFPHRGEVRGCHIYIYTPLPYIHTPLLPLYYYHCHHYHHQVWDYYVDRRKLEFVPWAESVPAVAYDSTTPMSLVTVPTGET